MIWRHSDCALFMQVLYHEQMGGSMPAPAPPGSASAGHPTMMLAPMPDRMRVDALPDAICGCCQDGETCCLAFFCSCCAHGVLCHDIEEKGYCLHCISWILASSCILPGIAPPFLGTFARIRLRDKYGLAGDKCEGVYAGRPPPVSSSWRILLYPFCTMMNVVSHSCSMRYRNLFASRSSLQALRKLCSLRYIPR